MALIELIKGNITGKMIDGFISDVNSLKTTAAEIKHKRYNYYLYKYGNKEITRFLNSDVGTNSLLYFYNIIKEIIINTNCPMFRTNIRNYTDKLRCFQMAFISGKSNRSLENKTTRWRGKANADEVLQTYKKEFHNIRDTSPDKIYFINIIVFNNLPQIPCSLKDGCCYGWINKMNFIIKQEDTYIDYSFFKKASNSILNHWIDRYKEIRGL